MIDFKEIPEDGEYWELFARDFLTELGFVVESPPDRGADGGKDLLISEDLKGSLSNYNFRWLVSCKHFAKSNKSVSEKDELNIQERLDSFSADGFIGFYSTIPSSGLNTRLRDLKEKTKIKDYKIFDSKLIENYLVRLGYSKILMRYCPESYKRVKPLHLIYNEYLPLKCKNCDKDLLQSLNYESYTGIIVYVQKVEPLLVTDKNTYIEDLYWVCKGECDKKLELPLRKAARNARQTSDEFLLTSWEDISDLAIPALYLKWFFANLNTLRDGTYIYSELAFKNLKYFISAMSQKVMREMTEQERKRIITLYEYGVSW